MRNNNLGQSPFHRTLACLAKTAASTWREVETRIMRPMLIFTKESDNYCALIEKHKRIEQQKTLRKSKSIKL